MSAAAADRRHAHEVELAMEIVALVDHEAEIDRQGDALRDRRWQFLRPVGRFICALIDGVPGARRAVALFIAGIETLRTEDRLDRIEDRDRARIRAIAQELAGVKDGTVQVTH